MFIVLLVPLQIRHMYFPSIHFHSIRTHSLNRRIGMIQQTFVVTFRWFPLNQRITERARRDQIHQPLHYVHINITLCPVNKEVMSHHHLINWVSYLKLLAPRLQIAMPPQQQLIQNQLKSRQRRQRPTRRNKAPNKTNKSLLTKQTTQRLALNDLCGEGCRIS